jgi:capsular exopolysaccharide synthesis family protein
MLRRSNETDVTKGLETNNIRIVQPAAVPVTPMPAWRTVKFLASLGLTLAMGVGLAFLVEIFDKRFKSPGEAEQALRLPFLGLIPAYRIDARDRSSSLLPWQQVRSPVADAYRNVRTNLQFFAVQQPLRSLLITSAVAEEGKSTTAVNLGMAFAQLGKVVLLVDADLRRPTLHQFFRLPNERGLSDILIHGQAWHQFVASTVVENLQVLSSGPIPYNPTELLSTTRMKTLIEHLTEAFDIVIYEAPMVLSIPDAAVVSAAMDGVLLVHNPARGNREVVIAAKQALERARANIVGLIFNAVEVSNVPRLSSKYYAGRDAMTPTAPRHNGTRVETSATPGLAARLIPVGQTRMSDGLAITIHRLLFETAVDQTEAEPGWVFLIADVEISNTRDISLPFYTYATAICRQNLNKYGQALSKIYARESQNHASREEDIIKFDHVTRDIDSGLQDEETIPAHSTKRGFIVYKVQQGSQHYMFMYEHDHIDITIPLVMT